MGGSCRRVLGGVREDTLLRRPARVSCAVVGPGGPHSECVQRACSIRMLPLYSTEVLSVNFPSSIHATATDSLLPITLADGGMTLRM